MQTIKFTTTDPSLIRDISGIQLFELTFEIQARVVTKSDGVFDILLMASNNQFVLALDSTSITLQLQAMASDLGEVLTDSTRQADLLSRLNIQLGRVEMTTTGDEGTEPKFEPVADGPAPLTPEGVEAVHVLVNTIALRHVGNIDTMIGTASTAMKGLIDKAVEDGNPLLVAAATCCGQEGCEHPAEERVGEESVEI